VSSFIKNNYKIILSIIFVILLIFVSPILIEIIFKSGNIIGTMIRTYGTKGICF